MTVKIIGAFCILGVCGGYGYYLSRQQHLEKRLLVQMLHLIDYMECELQHKMTPLPALCQKCAQEVTGILRTVFSQLNEELSSQTFPDTAHCMDVVLSNRKDIPSRTKNALMLLGAQLGRFDLVGQLQCLNSVRGSCKSDLDFLNDETQINGKRYQTLGLCVGAALVIIFI